MFCTKCIIDILSMKFYCVVESFETFVELCVAMVFDGVSCSIVDDIIVT